MTKAPDSLRMAIKTALLEEVAFEHSDEDGTHLTGLDEATWRILALIQQPAVKVKALEWKEPSQLTNGCWVADTPFTGYSICHEDCRFHVICEGWNISGDDQDVALDCPTLKAAKAAAQAHYDKAIREALEPIPDGWGVFPLEPTEAMLEASWRDTQEVSASERMAAELGDARAAHRHKMRRRYRAMLSAAPVPDGMVMIEALRPRSGGNIIHARRANCTISAGRTLCSRYSVGWPPLTEKFDPLNAMSCVQCVNGYRNMIANGLQVTT